MNAPSGPISKAPTCPTSSGVPAGYKAMNDREAIKVMIEF
jgi:hypothetical protein